MNELMQNILTASFHGSIVIAAVILLRALLRKAPKKYICYLWLLAGLRLLMPFQIQSDLSLQPQALPEWILSWQRESPQLQAAMAEGTVLATLVTAVWLMVAACFGLVSLVSYIRLKGKVREAVKIPGGWESEHIDTAFILGFVRPRIYIPMGMPKVSRKHILSHERTHLDKGDHWIKMIGFLALALHWFNPLVWVAYILLCKDIEMACDERVVQFMELEERKEYSAALLRCSTNRIHYAATPVAFGEVSVKRRVISILNYRKPSFWLGLLSVLAIGFVAVCLVTSPAGDPQQPESAGLQAAVPTEPEEFRQAQMPPMEADPGWGVSMMAQANTPTTMTLRYGIGIPGIPWDGTAAYKQQGYWIEKWNGAAWEAVPAIAQAPLYEGSGAMELSLENFYGMYNEDELDWSLIYGPLPEGDYRVGVTITRNGEDKAHYAWFHVYANALSGAQAEAVERCEAALTKLVEGRDVSGNENSYSCTVYESNDQGQMLPVRTYIRSNGAGRIDSYVGDICYNSTYVEPTDSLLSNWDKPFRLDQNKHISFPEGESLISDEKIQFLSQWADNDGQVYRQENTYTFAQSGKLESVHQVVQTSQPDGTVTQSQRRLSVESAHFSDTNDTRLQPKDSHEAALESPWNIFFRVDDDYLAATGGEVWLAIGSETIGITNYTTDSRYWLEKMDGTNWKKLTAQAEDPHWGSETYRLSTVSTSLDVDWTAYYGKLEPGLYRMGKHFYSGSESIIQYAEFKIHPEGSIIGRGGEEAIARVNAAVERLKSRNSHIIQQRIYTNQVEPVIESVYWKYGDVCVRDYYNTLNMDGYSHSTVNYPDDDFAYLFYDSWTWTLSWQEPNIMVYFADGASVISDREITFATTFSGEVNGAYLTWHSIFFDEDGEIKQIEYRREELYYPNAMGKCTQTVQNTSDQEIQAWVEQIQAQNS